ncbi:MAG: LytTR family DNA-binding domain-containing protein [Coriobacteriia bacterium]|nr:LytTR family DNA-binding domain-containing protein [Coriobacteriia bacterium]
MGITEKIIEGSAPLRVIFCDTDSDHVKRYAQMVKQTCLAQGVPVQIAFCKTGEQLLHFVEKYRLEPVIIVSDVDLPGYPGLDVLRAISKLEADCQIIILATIPAYALEGYEVDAVAYLLKGVTSPEMFTHTFKRAMDRVIEDTLQYVTFSCAGTSQTVRVSDIAFFAVDHKIVTVHYQEGSFEFYSTLGKIEDTLADHGFMRVHRNYVVALSKVVRVDHDELVLESDERIPVGRNYRKAVLTALDSLVSKVS